MLSFRASGRFDLICGLLVAALALPGCEMLPPLPAGSCRTSTYGKSFVRNERDPDQYALAVYVAGPPGSCREDALNVLQQEAPKFMAQQQYQAYEVVSDRFNVVPSYFEFNVRFSRSGK
jgi:hypothetical protein